MKVQQSLAFIAQNNREDCSPSMQLHRRFLPEGWQECSLGDLLSMCQYGLSIPGSENGQTPMLGMKNLNDGQIIFDQAPRVTLTPHELSQYSLVKGDILFNRTNSYDQVGKAALYDSRLEAVFASYLLRLRVRTEKVSPEYLAYCLNAPYYQEVIKALATRGVSQYNINPTQLRARLSILLPPRTHRQRIVDILGVADETVRTTEALIKTNTCRKAALAEDLLTGRRRIPEFRACPWYDYRLGELFTERVEQNRPDLPLLAVTGNEGIVVRDSLVKRDTSNKDKSLYLRVAPGDIAYNTMRMWQGVSALSGLEGIVSPAYTVCTPNHRVDPAFMAHLFKLPQQIDRFRRYSQGLVSDTLSLKFPLFARVHVRIPEVTEQKRIAQILGLADSEITLLKDEFAVLKKQKLGLVQKLLTGDVPVEGCSP